MGQSRVRRPIPCERCGELVLKRRRPDRRIYCIDCAVAVVAEYARARSAYWRRVREAKEVLRAEAES